MLTIRMQRTGRKGHAQFRVVVQDSRFSPSSGRVVAHLGSYNPHSKTTTLDKEKIQTYLTNGAQPSDRVTALLKKEGVKLPTWVTPSAPKTSAIRHADKLRRNRPAEEPAAEVETPTEATEPAATKEMAPAEAAAPVAESEAAPEETAPAAEEVAETDAQAPAKSAKTAE